MTMHRVLAMLAVLFVPTVALASYQCDQLTIGQICTYRDGYDMATCSRSYCGDPQYNCETCPGLLDAGVDLSGRAPVGDGGCQMAARAATGTAPLHLVLALLVGALLRRRVRSSGLPRG